VRVLYVNHTGLVGGAERSLLSLLDSVAPDIETRLACPAGPLPEHAARHGHDVVAIAECAGSLKLHPVHTPIALGAMAVAAASVLKTARTHGVEVMHANSIRAGLIAEPVARALRLPLVLHVRDCLPPSELTRRLQRSLAARCAAVIAISRHVAGAFDPDRVAPRLAVIDNPFDLAHLNPERIDRRAARARLALRPDDLALVLVGQITPWKGQEEAIRALARIRATHRSAVLLLVGEAKFVARATRYDNRSYLRGLHRLVAELRLNDAVRFLGEREDVPEILRAADIALAPSWDEPFGRAVVEAMAIGSPIVATSVGGPAEIIRDGVDGLLVAPRRPDQLADAISGLLSDRERRDAIAAAGRATATGRFGSDHHAAAVTRLYRQVLEAAGKTENPTGNLKPLGSLH
jgi:glycosyltransferase involved in cell wall biosynthesis